MVSSAQDVVYAGFWQRFFASIFDVTLIVTIAFLCSGAHLALSISGFYEEDNGVETNTLIEKCTELTDQCEAFTAKCAPQNKQCMLAEGICIEKNKICNKTQNLVIDRAEKHTANSLSTTLGWIPIVASLLIPSWLFFRASPGKLLFKLRIVDTVTFERMHIWQGLVRFLGYLVYILPLWLAFMLGYFKYLGHFIVIIPLLLGVIFILFDKKNRCLHDMIARTVVIHKAKKNS